MSKATRALQWFSDVTQVLFLDRFNARRRHLAEAASTACRSLNFHSRSRIRPVPLVDLLSRMGCDEVTSVTLPGPSTLFGDVGSMSGYHVLGSLMKGLRPASVLEFGTYLGVSAYAMALNTPPDCRIHTVDLPDATGTNVLHELNALDQRHVATSRHRVGEAFLRSPEQKRITQIRADSLEFRAESLVSNIDFVYVDGGHSRPIVSSDTENAFRVLSNAGTILWDDYFHLYPDVVEFLNEMADRHEMHSIAGTNYVIHSRRWRKKDDQPKP
jgi:predicted O-methyltransferase YrrM